MNKFTVYGLAAATTNSTISEQIVDSVWEFLRTELVKLVETFLATELAPQEFFRFELSLLSQVRDVGRQLMEKTLNALEDSPSRSLPKELWHENGGYRRLRQKTRNAHLSTLLGTVELWRYGYRSWEAGEQTIFPLQMRLGFTEGVSPGLADWIGRQMAEAGTSQGRVLEALKTECDVSMGAKRLRAFTHRLGKAFEEHRQNHQVTALLEALEKARQSKGNRRPVLSVGRDGITLRQYATQCFEVATAATVSVYDRAGKRLLTIYLAHPSELGQATMSRLLSELLRELFEHWEGPLPQLAYVADSGGNESSYFEKKLTHMKHPGTGKRLKWQRVVDFYHAASRVWEMAHALFGKNSQAGTRWAKRMLKNLKKPRGTRCLLQSASSFFHRLKLSQGRREDFQKAYRYIRKRTRYMRYHQYRRQHIPLGSGVTEAACKTVFTQRLKLSGQRWSRQGAKTILSLRVVLLSKTWQSTFQAFLKSINPVKLQPYRCQQQKPLKIAA